MRRWIFVFASAISLLLCLILLYTWIRSYLPQHWTLDSSDGRLLFILWEGNLPDGGMQRYNPGSKDAFRGVTDLWQAMSRTSDNKWLGFGYSTGWVMRYIHVRIVAIPIWFLVILTAILPTLWFLALRRHRNRLKFGHCLQCGYDLRESKGNCPECGAAIPAPLTVNPRAV